MNPVEGAGFLLKVFSVVAVLIGAPSTVRVTSAECALITEPIDPCRCLLSENNHKVLDCSSVESAQELLDIPGLHSTPGILFNSTWIGSNPNITEIPERAFGVHSSMGYVFHNNPMLSFIHPLFVSNSGIDKVIFLGISGNPALISFPFDTVKKLNSLESLYIHGNQIRTIPASAFNNASKALWNVQLWGNQITFIGANAFNGLPSLAELNLHDNKISALIRDSLAFEGEALRLDLSDNRLSYFDEDFIQTLPRTNGRVMELMSNLIEKLDEKVWRPILERSLEPASVDQPVQPKVDISDNPLKCDCQMYWLYQMKEAEPVFGGTLNCDDGIGDLWLHDEAHFEGCH